MNLPNKITCVRMALIPIFIICFECVFPYHELLALILFCVASFTDFLDGNIARKRGLVTDFGKFMDPLADKLLVTSALVCLVGVGYIPSWIVILILAREFAVTGLRTLAANDGTVIAASKWGKLKTVTQMIAIIALLLFMIPGCDFSWLWTFGQIMVWVCAAMTLISGIDYFVLNRGVFKSM